MNTRIIKSLVLGFAFAVVVFAGSASSGAAQVCDAYGCYYPDPSYGVVPAPGYGGCDPYTGICYEAVPAPVYGGACDPYLGCVNIVQAPVYQPAYAPICDPFTGVCV
jgi:hypothetical protein